MCCAIASSSHVAQVPCFPISVVFCDIKYKSYLPWWYTVLSLLTELVTSLRNLRPHCRALKAYLRPSAFLEWDNMVCPSLHVLAPGRSEVPRATQGRCNEMNMICSKIMWNRFKKGPQNCVHPVSVKMTSYHRRVSKFGPWPRWNSPQSWRSTWSSVHKTLSRPKETTWDRQSRVKCFVALLTLRADQHYQRNGSRRIFRSVRCRTRGTVAAPEGSCLLEALVSNTSHCKEMTLWTDSWRVMAK